ncbi:hypothetical protein [Klenkia sp. PcliD-1-E]|uniref:glycosyltransferase family protein n=1 Tax=Klenkia sp. PcliD-1-E TaxID=2954492 RepID=UPI002097527E|nr:hypothetical protein [Klenkia sp. PcliD-1-E]MCO7221845.1 hypothetical protein [Klenkia sp. PcliD-1-E]
MTPHSTRPAGSPSRVLFASHTPETGVFRVGSHHLSRALARRGLQVGHMSTPLSPVKLVGLGNRVGLRSRFSSTVAGPQEDGDGRVSVVPFTTLPVQLTAGWPVNLALHTGIPGIRRTVRAAGLDRPDFLLMDQPMFAGLGSMVGARTVVYRPTDVYTGARMRAAQERALAECSAVVATSETVLAQLARRARDLPHLVLVNGVDAPFFRSGERHTTTADDAVVYVGALDERLDWDWLRDLAHGRPDVRVDLFGPEPDQVPEGLGDNVRFRGPLDYGRAPEVLSGYRTALMPFGDSTTNDGRSPMKLFEYLAAGLRVLATPHFAGSSAPPPGVRVVADAAAGVGDLPAMLSDRDRNDAGAAVADGHDWSRRSSVLLDFLRSLPRRGTERTGSVTA